MEYPENNRLESTEYEGVAVEVENEKKVKPKNRIRAITVVIIAVVTICIVGIIIGISLKSKNNGSVKSSGNVNLDYSKYTQKDNLAFRLFEKEGEYIVDFLDEDIAADFKIRPIPHPDENGEYGDLYHLENDKIKITSYWYSLGNLDVEGLFGNENVNINFKINSHYTSLTEQFDVLESYDRLYKVLSKKNKKYRILLKLEDDYYIEIKSDRKNGDEEVANTVFDALKGKIRLCYVPYSDGFNLDNATQSINDTTKVDVSDWTFVEDKLFDYTSTLGIEFKRENLRVVLFESNPAGFRIQDLKYRNEFGFFRNDFEFIEMTKESYENELKTKESANYMGDLSDYIKINVKQFDEAYVSTSYVNDGKYLLKQGDKYYIVDAYVVDVDTKDVDAQSKIFEDALNEILN